MRLYIAEYETSRKSVKVGVVARTYEEALDNIKDNDPDFVRILTCNASNKYVVQLSENYL